MRGENTDRFGSTNGGGNSNPVTRLQALKLQCNPLAVLCADVVFRSPALGLFPGRRRVDSRPGASEIGAEAQQSQPLLPYPAPRHGGARPLSAPAAAAGDESRQQPFGCSFQGRRRGPSMPPPARGQVVLVPLPRVAAGPSRELQQPPGVVHRGGELVALQDHAREDLVHPTLLGVRTHGGG